jgi:hypothetical protein
VSGLCGLFSPESQHHRRTRPVGPAAEFSPGRTGVPGSFAAGVVKAWENVEKNSVSAVGAAPSDAESVAEPASSVPHLRCSPNFLAAVISNLGHQIVILSGAPKARSRRTPAICLSKIAASLFPAMNPRVVRTFDVRERSNHPAKAPLTNSLTTFPSARSPLA